MKRTMTGMLALAAMAFGMSAFKSADAAVVKGNAVDSVAHIDSIAAPDSIRTVDSIRNVDTAAFHIDSISSLDSLRTLDSLGSVDSVRTLDSLSAPDSLSIRLDSLKNIDSLSAVDSVKSVDSIRAAEGASITGKITPADGATEVEADLGGEKVKGAITDGTFTIPAAKAGSYTITIKGKQPYKDAVIKDVKVEDGKATDLGEIKLEQ